MAGPAPGMNSQELMGQLRASTLTRSSNGHGTVDPITDAIATRKAILGQRLLEQTTADAEAEAVEAENRRIKAEIEREQLRESRGGRASDKYVEMLAAQMDRLQAELADARQAISDQQTQALSERMSMLTAEIERLEARQSEPGASPMQSALDAVAQAKELMNALSPTTERVPERPMAPDPTIKLWEVKANYEHQRWVAERDDRHNERMEELRLKNQVEIERLEIERKSAEVRNRFFSETAPKLLETFGPLFQKFAAMTNSASLEGAAVAAQVRPATGPPPVPEGAQVTKCETCGAWIIYREEFAGVFCSTCGAEYSFKQDAPTDKATGAVA